MMDPFTARARQLPDVIAESLDSLQSAAAEISATDGARPTPCRDWNVTQVLQHAVAGPAAELLRYLGRDPSWPAPLRLPSRGAASCT